MRHRDPMHDEAPTSVDPLPLTGLTEDLRFGTDEGTWVSVDVTPDGTTVVFDLLGDLYEMPITGGRVARLTDGLPYDTQPRVSPDGRWIAFVSDRGGADNLWVMDRAGGNRRQLSDNEHSVSISPSWTPDGTRILVAECLSYLSEARFRWYPLLGGPPQDVTDADSRPVRGAGGVMSPDGHHLYFSRRDPNDELRYLMPVAQLRRLDLRTGRLETLSEGRGGGTRPVLSPDGRLLVYATRHETRTALRVRDLRSGSDRQLIWPVQQDRQDYGRPLRGDHLPNYAFTPDGAALLLSYGGKIRRVALHDGASSVVPFHVDVTLPVGPELHRACRVEQGPVTARIVHTPAWSPDGRQVAMSALTKIQVMDVGRRAEPRRLTRSEDVELQPAWSPDGRWIAYVVWTPLGRGQIWSARSDGSEVPRRLTSVPAFYTDLTYSPDGSRILAMRGLDTRPGALADELPCSLDLVWLPAQGGEVRVVQAAHRGRHPHVAGDPGRIYTSDGHSLFSLRYDGTDEQTHLTVVGRFDTEENTQPAAERILASPDGTQALALIDKQLWRLPGAPPGAAPLTVDVRAGHEAAARLTEVGADYFGWADARTVFWAIGSTIYRSPLMDRCAQPLERAPTTEAFPAVVRAARATPGDAIVLRGGRVIPMTAQSAASILDGADIVIERNRIVSVGPVGEVAVPVGARTIDISGMFVLPGFVDTHAHWAYPPPELAEPDNWSLRANLAYGVTTGLDVQSNHVANFLYQDLVETGQTVGPRAFMVGPGVFGVNNYKPYEADFRSYEETLAYLRRYQQHYRVHLVKVYLSGNRRQRQWLVMACQELGLMATTEGFGDPGLHLTHAMDGMHGNEHALTDSEIYADVVETLARTRTTHTSTLTITHYGLPGMEYFLSRIDVHDDPKLNRFYPREVLLELTGRRRVWGHTTEFSIVAMAKQAAKIQRAGGLVGVGSHGEIQGLGYHWEMEMLTMGGMTPAEVLTAATRDGARIIGFEPDLGSIEPGKLADLVVLGANPLEDIRNTQHLVHVMKDGVLRDGDTLAVV